MILHCADAGAVIHPLRYNGYTVGSLITDTLSLTEKGRAEVIEYISLQKIRLLWQAYKKKSDK